MKIKYVGPHDAVDLPGLGSVAHGKAIEVTGPVAPSLLAQKDHWQRIDPPKPRKSSTRKPRTPQATVDRSTEERPS